MSVARRAGDGSEHEPGTGPGDAETIRASFDQLPVAIGTTRGPEHVFVGANAAYRLFSADRPILGRPAREVFSEAMEQGVFDSLDLAYVSGKTQSGREWRIQLDRGHGPEDIYIDFTISPVLGADGGSIGLNIVLVDISEQVRGRLLAQRRTVEAQRRYEAVRDVVGEMQAALLPTALPVLPTVQVAASYLLADADTAAGGDWFDAFALPDGRLALVVGDVVGHGVAASATMGQLRIVLHERLVTTCDVVAALEAVDRVAEVVPGGRAATVCVAVLDQHSGELTYCTAGHPPPLLIAGGAGAARYLPGTGSGTLGTGSRFAVAREQVGERDMLLLYTDGLLERPGRDVTASVVELAGFAADIAADRVFRGDSALAVDRLTSQTLELMTRQTGYSDDITLLAAARGPAVAPLRMTLPSELPAVTRARTVVDEWLEQIAACTEDHVALEHAVVELVTNACEHAPPDPRNLEGSTVAIEAELDQHGFIRLSVADNGRWREPRTALPADRGYGLAMTRSLVDDLAIDRTADGTCVQVCRRASRHARLLTATATSPTETDARHDEDLDQMRIVDQSGPGGQRIAVSGVLDATTVEDLGTELDHRTLAGTTALVVDLTGVTHLASAAVAELHRTPTIDAGPPILLYAPAGSTAQHVLDLVKLPHTTIDPATESSSTSS